MWSFIKGQGYWECPDDLLVAYLLYGQLVVAGNRIHNSLSLDTQDIERTTLMRPKTRSKLFTFKVS